MFCSSYAYVVNLAYFRIHLRTLRTKYVAGLYWQLLQYALGSNCIPSINLVLNPRRLQNLEPISSSSGVLATAASQLSAYSVFPFPFVIRIFQSVKCKRILIKQPLNSGSAPRLTLSQDFRNFRTSVISAQTPYVHVAEISEVLLYKLFPIQHVIVWFCSPKGRE